ncbi:MAG: thioredoxin [Cytophagales bacterium]
MAKTSFSEIIKGDTPVLVDFFAEWCGPCKMMKPELEKFKSQLGDKVKVIKIDIDKNQAMAGQYKIASVPTLMFFKNGQIMWRQGGACTSSQLLSVFNQINR